MCRPVEATVSVGDPEQRQLKFKHVWYWFVLLPTTAGRSQVRYKFNMDEHKHNTKLPYSCFWAS